MIEVPKIGFNLERNVKFLPRIKFIDNYYAVWQRELYKTILYAKDFKIFKMDGYFVVQNSLFTYYAPKNYAGMTIKEWRMWERSYLPHFSLKNKTVLDVGAGCGETAIFYALHGAKKVVLVEANKELEKFIKVNLQINGITDYELLLEPFNAERHLSLSFDFMKMDIEGGEEALLQEKINFPAVIEVHSRSLRNAFFLKGFRISEEAGRGVWIMNNF
jgi:hypothetical protein